MFWTLEHKDEVKRTVSWGSDTNSRPQLYWGPLERCVVHIH